MVLIIIMFLIWRCKVEKEPANIYIELYNNFEEDSLFFNPDNTIKKDLVKEDIKTLILSGVIKNNKQGLKYSLLKGCEPMLFTEVIKELEDKKEIELEGDKNYSSKNIHKVKIYTIKRLKDGA